MPQSTWYERNKPQQATPLPTSANSWYDRNKPQTKAPVPTIPTPAPTSTNKSYWDKLNETYNLNLDEGMNLIGGAWNKLKHIPESLYKGTSFGQLESMTDELSRTNKLTPEQKVADDIQKRKEFDEYNQRLGKVFRPTNLREAGKSALDLTEAGVTALDPTGIASSVIPMGRSMYGDIENKDWGGLAGDVTAGILAPLALHKGLSLASGKTAPKIVPDVEPPPGEYPWGSYSPIDLGKSSPYPRPVQKQLPGRVEQPRLPAMGETTDNSTPRFYQGKAGVVDVNDNPMIDWTDPAIIDNMTGPSGDVVPAIPMDVAERGYPGFGRLADSVRFNPDTKISPDYVDESPNIRTQNAGVIKPSEKFTESLNEPFGRKKPSANQLIGTKLQYPANTPATLPYGTVNQSGFGVAPKPFRLAPYADTPFPTEAGITEPIVTERPFELGPRDTAFPTGEPRPTRPSGEFKYKVKGAKGEPPNIRFDELLPSAEKSPRLPPVEQPRNTSPTRPRTGQVEVTFNMKGGRPAGFKPKVLPKVEPVEAPTIPQVTQPITEPTPVKPVGLFGRAKKAVGKVSDALITGVDTELTKLGDSGKKISKMLGDAKTEARRYAGQYAVNIRAAEKSLSKAERAELGKAFTGDVDSSNLSPKAKSAYDTLKQSTEELERQAGKGSLGFDTSVGNESVKDLNSLRQYQAELARDITHNERFTKLQELIDSSSDPERASRLVDHYLMKDKGALDSDLQGKLYKGVANYEGATHLQQFGVTNLGDLADFPGVFGARNTARAIAETAASPHKSVDFSTRTGAQQAVHSGEASDLGSKFSKLTGGKAVEKFNRTVGAKAGRYAAKDFFEKAKKNPAKYSDRLARFVDGDVKDILKQDALTEKQLDFASNRGTELTSGSPDRLTLPRGFNPKNQLLKIPTLYKRFAFLKLKNIKSTINAQPTLAGKIAKLSAIAGVNLAAGEVIGDTKKAISGLISGNVSEKIKNRGDYIGTDYPILDRILANALQSSLFGLVGDVAESATSSKRNKVSGFVGGPVLSDADELANALSSLKENKSGDRNFNPLAKYVGKRLPIPFIGGTFGDTFTTESKPKSKSLSRF